MSPATATSTEIVVDKALFTTSLDAPVHAYGYWLSPDGTFFEVPYEGHEHTAGKIQKASGDESDEYAYTFLYRHGWVRGVSENSRYAYVALPTTSLSPQQIKAIGSIYRQMSQESFRVGGLPDRSAVDFPAGDSTQLRKLNALLRDHTGQKTEVEK